MSIANSVPTKDGRYGKFGGQFVPETLMTALLELEATYDKALNDPTFTEELAHYLQDYVGRETPLYYLDQSDKGAWWCQNLFKA